MSAASEILPGIEHVILLMFENRSFDNVLGAIYPPSPDGGGVPAGWSNPWPSCEPVKAWSAPQGSAAGIIPYPDPHELWAHMSQQIHDYGPMQGFVADYQTASTSKHKVQPRDIMQFFNPANVPVTSALAKAYMASDRYFASGPVQTWPNRLFSLCGTPGMAPDGKPYLNNEQYPGYSSYPPIQGQLNWPSIFQQLDNAGKSWRVYYDDEEPIAALIEYVWKNWWKVECGGNVWPLSYSDESWCPRTFFSDVEDNTLPSFSLLEPRYQYLSGRGYQAPTSNHPGSSSATDDNEVPINVSCGERLLAQVYNALAAQKELFNKTLLVVTYDEHGGIFDHVYPPPAKSPFKDPPPVRHPYESYGVRVPTLFVNPRVYKPGALYRPPAHQPYPFDHTSLLATLRNKWDLTKNSPELSPRVAAAPPFEALLLPDQSTVTPTKLPVPECTWSPPAAGPSRAGHSMPEQRFASALRVVRKLRNDGER